MAKHDAEQPAATEEELTQEASEQPDEEQQETAPNGETPVPEGQENPDESAPTTGNRPEHIQSHQQE